MEFPVGDAEHHLLRADLELEPYEGGEGGHTFVNREAKAQPATDCPEAVERLALTCEGRLAADKVVHVHQGVKSLLPHEQAIMPVMQTQAVPDVLQPKGSATWT